jgi:lipopolysaccharide biosynthesis glycosyltransferase
MKWVFTFNDFSEDTFYLVKVAVNSAIKNTSLEPYCLFDGKPNSNTQWLEKAGVRVIHHHPFYKEMIEGNIQSIKRVYDGICYGPVSEKFIRSAFLRVEIPRVFCSDEYVAYTDTDIVFLKNPDFDAFKPQYIGAVSYSNHNYFNSGVMLLNIHNMSSTYDNFCTFIKSKNCIFKFGDQGAYDKFYCNKWSHMPKEYNHRVMGEYNPGAYIIHFPGNLKPGGSLEKAIAGDFTSINDLIEPAKKFYYEKFAKHKEDIKICSNIWSQYNECSC